MTISVNCYSWELLIKSWSDIDCLICDDSLVKKYDSIYETYYERTDVILLIYDIKKKILIE